MPREFLYVYGTLGREDGMTTAVGTIRPVSERGAVPEDSTVALFRDPYDAHTFAYAVQRAEGGTVVILPSADVDETTPMAYHTHPANLPD